MGTKLAKFDIQSAYRIVPVCPSDRHLLGVVWRGELFVDTALPFGLRSAPIIFTAVADALQFILQEKGVQHIMHYLDDFLVFGEPSTLHCSKALQLAMEWCTRLGCLLQRVRQKVQRSALRFLGLSWTLQRESFGYQRRSCIVYRMR